MPHRMRAVAIIDVPTIEIIDRMGSHQSMARADRHHDVWPVTHPTAGRRRPTTPSGPGSRDVQSPKKQRCRSLQLFDAENSLGVFSLPQIFRPARRGFARKNAFRSAKCRSIAPLHASIDS
jgi:hypothetical protein